MKATERLSIIVPQGSTVNPMGDVVWLQVVVPKDPKERETLVVSLQTLTSLIENWPQDG